MGYIHICCHMAWFRVVILAFIEFFLLNYLFLFGKIEAEDGSKLLLFWVLIVFVIRKLLSWAWLTCLFFVPEMMLKSAATTFQVMSVYLPHLFARNYLILVIVLQLASFVFFPTRIILCFFRKVENFPFTMIWKMGHNSFKQKKMRVPWNDYQY